jgi:hypothetical protein
MYSELSMLQVQYVCLLKTDLNETTLNLKCVWMETEILNLLNVYRRTKSYSHNSGNRQSQLRHFHLILVCINTVNLTRDRGSTSQSCDYQNEENCWYCHFVVTTDRSQCSLKEDREYHLADKLSLLIK